MIVEVTGTGTANKGAELLLVAIKQQLENTASEYQLAVTAGFGRYEDRARYGLRTVLPEIPKGRWWLAGKLMPAAFRWTNGLVAESEVDVVLDASGFAFGDQLGAARVQEFARDVTRWKGQGKPIVLLPQALGPFDNAAVRTAFQGVVNNVDLIFAREKVSYDYVAALNVPAGKLKLAPDFTNLVKCQRGENTSVEYQSLLVPNHQMIAKTGSTESEKYVPFLARCFRSLRKFELAPAVLLHDDNLDCQLMEPLRTALGEDFPVITERDPLALKAALGRARLVIGSRFHALVGSLSQGIPSIAIGWSHKYQMLLADYDCTDSLLRVSDTDDQISELIRLVTSEWGARNQRVIHAGERLQQQTREMWKSVFQAIGLVQESVQV